MKYSTRLSIYMFEGGCITGGLHKYPPFFLRDTVLVLQAGEPIAVAVFISRQSGMSALLYACVKSQCWPQYVKHTVTLIRPCPCMQ